jgi:hypothetical protein
MHSRAAALAKSSLQTFLTITSNYLATSALVRNVDHSSMQTPRPAGLPLLSMLKSSSLTAVESVFFFANAGQSSRSISSISSHKSDRAATARSIWQGSKSLERYVL